MMTHPAFFLVVGLVSGMGRVMTKVVFVIRILLFYGYFLVKFSCYHFLWDLQTSLLPFLFFFPPFLFLPRRSFISPRLQTSRAILEFYPDWFEVFLQILDFISFLHYFSTFGVRTWDFIYFPLLALLCIFYPYKCLRNRNWSRWRCFGKRE